jgi:hypothetical protein
MEDLQEQLTQQPQVTQEQAAPKSFASSLQPLVQSPTDDFVVSLLDLADKHDALDSAMMPDSVEDQADVAGDEDVRQFLQKDEMQMLLDKWSKVPPEFQQLLLTKLQEASPRVHKRVMAAMRMLGADKEQQ